MDTHTYVHICYGVYILTVHMVCYAKLLCHLKCYILCPAYHWSNEGGSAVGGV